jgi:hypothetical protein
VLSLSGQHKYSVNHFESTCKFHTNSKCDQVSKHVHNIEAPPSHLTLMNLWIDVIHPDYIIPPESPKIHSPRHHLIHTLRARWIMYWKVIIMRYGDVSKSFLTGRQERKLQMVQLSATRRSYIAILWVSLVSFAAITLCVASQRVCCCLFRYRLSPETFGYTFVFSNSRQHIQFCTECFNFEENSDISVKHK